MTNSPAQDDTPAPSAPPGASDLQLLADRSCGTCMLCCKLPSIRSLDKPQGKWCVHARPGSGCANYSNRPAECSGFYCLWRMDASLGPEWKPDRAKFYLTISPSGNLSILVDPAAPAAWRDERYYRKIKIVAAKLRESGKDVVVFVGHRATVVFPEKDIDVGFVPDGFWVRVFPVLVNGVADFTISVEPSPN
jgi:hypothetical protein